jgi:hypothetical protein
LIYVFVLSAASLGTALYLLLMYSSIPGAVDERLGSIEPLPEDLDRWLSDETSVHGRAAQERGLRREVRTLLVPAQGLFGREHFLKQARLRSPDTGEIIEVEAEVNTPRRRRRG